MRAGHTMKLATLFPEDTIGAAADVEVTGIAFDSRKVRPGAVFFAVPGSKADGARFARAAAEAGAVAVAAEQPIANVPAQTIFIRVGNVRRALALAAAALYPRQPATIAAVTGTSGKTSVASFTRQIWSALGYAAASVGTIGVTSPKGEVYGSLTTPDPVELHRTLDTLAGEGVTHLALEASSHGLDQHRLDGVRVAAGAFTNLSRDHLDYHPTLEAYLAAKLRLFEALVEPGGTAVIDVDGTYAAQVVMAVARRGLSLMTVGRRGEDIQLVDGSVEGFAQVVTMRHGGIDYRVRLPLVGAFQVENAAVAAGLAIATGSEPGRVFAALEDVKGASGRLELCGTRRGAPIFVDYAHKPDALAKALDALRPYAPGRLVVVFGCGGDRDKGKRPLMGEIATAKADRVIITDDNPRSEDPAAIRAEILAAAPGAMEIGDRAQAIRAGIAMLDKGDVLLIAGKGHESGQIVGDTVLPFQDQEVVAAALKEMGE
jgi:UDP-N-acetylmuramoyl-L-alanyl-D-glutamate--2,6-diaminopimelate ligase